MATGRKKGRREEEVRCRRHPRHRQPAGVCASCLRERLSHLTSASASSSSSLPSVVRGEVEEEEASSCCSEASTEYSSSTEGSSGASSRMGSPYWQTRAQFHQEMMAGRSGGGRLSLLMKHERVLLDRDEVASVVRRMRERRATSFWTKLLHATVGGGKEGCSMAHSKTLHHQERSTVAKWILF
ncbi:hypothetical protein GUJ93_ZPchr0006g43001 [Zizania palustris]|uniref:Uncharacterized protein n=1 Tax=Zizania palustris TaxID=103762 RepID=A0A8J5SHQ8_ZIZPA|nr:hypothetical protein GUJ93_ZPchr0006g43001 [Zizania palustris]